MHCRKSHRYRCVKNELTARGPIRFNRHTGRANTFKCNLSVKPSYASLVNVAMAPMSSEIFMTNVYNILTRPSPSEVLQFDH